MTHDELEIPNDARTLLTIYRSLQNEGFYVTLNDEDADYDMYVNGLVAAITSMGMVMADLAEIDPETDDFREQQWMGVGEILRDVSQKLMSAYDGDGGYDVELSQKIDGNEEEEDE